MDYLSNSWDLIAKKQLFSLCSKEYTFALRIDQVLVHLNRLRNLKVARTLGNKGKSYVSIVKIRN